MIVGFIKMTNFFEESSLDLVLKNHLITGILERKGTPVPESFLTFSSNPPNIIKS